MRDVLLLIGRVLLAAMFVKTGLDKFFALGDTASYISSAGLPLAFLLAPLTAIAEVVLGLAIIVGFQTRWAALGLAIFCLITIPFFHAFWTMADQARGLNQLLALKNLSIAGGFLVLAAVGPGLLSVDRK